MTTATRKGARRMAEIPPDVLRELSTGQLQTVNLVEFLAVDLELLLRSVAAQIGVDPQHAVLEKVLRELPTLKPMRRHWAISAALQEAIAQDQAAADKLAGHPSDIARQWAALMVGLRAEDSLVSRLQRIRPLAADPHFGVREFASGWRSAMRRGGGRLSAGIVAALVAESDLQPAPLRFRGDPPPRGLVRTPGVAQTRPTGGVSAVASLARRSQSLRAKLRRQLDQ